MSLMDLTAIEIADHVKSGRHTAVEIAKCALAQIAARDPELNCFTGGLRDRALESAEAVDAALRAGARSRPPGRRPLRRQEPVRHRGRGDPGRIGDRGVQARRPGQQRHSAFSLACKGLVGVKVGFYTYIFLIVSRNADHLIERHGKKKKGTYDHMTS